MNIPVRLENALTKLYNAFHNDRLHPEDCTACAVGNILDNKEYWKHLSDDHGAFQLNYVGKVHQRLGRRFNGYTPLELLQIETVFLKACGYQIPLHHQHKKPANPTDKELLFEGLQAVVAFLCKLDRVPNVMDYSKLFLYENNKAIYPLEEILA